MTSADVASVAAVHLQAFPSFFLSTLGGRALQELYGGIVADPASIALVAEISGRIAGFVAGTTDARSYYRRLLLKRWWRFARALAVVAVRRPSVVLRLTWRIRAATSTQAQPGEAALMSLAVAPADQRHGVGRRLVIAFLDEARARGASRVALTTDAADNERIQAFYEAQGFRLRAAYVTVEHRAVHDYVIDM